MGNSPDTDQPLLEPWAVGNSWATRGQAVGRGGLEDCFPKVKPRFPRGFLW